MFSKVRSMKGDFGGVRVILGLLFKRDNEVEGELSIEEKG